MSVTSTVSTKLPYTGLVIRQVLRGCTNRPFFHIIVQYRYKDVFDEEAVLEQLGTYDPMPNEAGEKLVALNFDRLKYWIGSGAQASRSVEELLGLSGFFPVHPMSIIIARRNRMKIAKKVEEAQLAAAKEAKLAEDQAAAAAKVTA